MTTMQRRMRRLMRNHRPALGFIAGAVVSNIGWLALYVSGGRL